MPRVVPVKPVDPRFDEKKSARKLCSHQSPLPWACVIQHVRREGSSWRCWGWIFFSDYSFSHNHGSKNGCIWKATIGGTHSSLPWLWEEGYWITMNYSYWDDQVRCMLTKISYGIVWHFFEVFASKKRCIAWGDNIMTTVWDEIFLWKELRIDMFLPFVVWIWPICPLNTPQFSGAG